VAVARQRGDARAGRLELFDQASIGLQLQIADVLRCTSPTLLPGQIVELLRPGLSKLDAELRTCCVPNRARTRPGCGRA
jgi:hypothetical protein